MKHYRYDAEPVLVSRNRDGKTYRQQFSSAPLRYRDGRKWRAIDTRCSSVGKNHMNMVLAPYRLYIPKFSDETVAFENMGHAIMMKPLCGHVRGKMTGPNVMEYKNAFAQGVHLQYTAGRACFRKEIVITKKPSGEGDIVFDFLIDFENIANLDDYNLNDLVINGDLDLRQDGEFRSVIRRPRAWDALVDTAQMPLRIQKINGRYRMRKIIPRSFLEGAVYPIVTDAEVYYGIPYGGDGYVSNSNATYSTCRSATTGNAVSDSGTVVKIEGTYTGSLYKISRGFFVFDISSLSDDASVTAIDFKLWSTFSGDCYCRVYDPLADSDSDIGPPDALKLADFEWLQGGDVDAPTQIGGVIDARSSGWLTSALNATGLAAFDPTEDYFRLALRPQGGDVSVTAPTVVMYSYLASATGNYPPILEVTYDVPIVHEGTGGGEVEAVAETRASYKHSGEGGGEIGTTGGIVVPGSEVTDDGFYLVSKIAGVAGTKTAWGSPNSSFPLSNIKTTERPFKEFRANNTNLYVIWLYLNGPADTVILYNVNCSSILATVVTGTNYALTTIEEKELGIYSAAFLYDGWFTRIAITLQSGAVLGGDSFYKCGGVLAGMRTELSVRPKPPSTRRFKQPVSEKRYGNNNIEIESLGYPHLAMRYSFPEMTPTQFQQVEEVEREMTAQGLCGIIERRVDANTRDHAYVAYRSGDIKYAHTDNGNILATLDFEGIS